MFQPFARIFAALLLPLALMSCMLAPGKFTSTLTINANRSFAYNYQGEVYAIDISRNIASGLKTGTKDRPADPAEAARVTAENDRKAREVAAALSREAGYRKAEYLGQGRFMIDYAIEGRLTHNFVYPVNLDAEIIFPFIAIELRADNRVRVKAPAFGRSNGNDLPASIDENSPTARLDGTFTLDTDAEIVSQNNENGVTNAGTRKRIAWRVTPQSNAAPMAVLAFRGN